MKASITYDEPRVTIKWLLPKENTFSNHPVFFYLHGRIKMNMISIKNHKDPFWTEYGNENPVAGDRCDINVILKNAKKVKKLKINILDIDAKPYLVSTLQSLVFPKFEKLEHLSISAFLTFENLMKLRDSLHKNVEESNLNNLELVELDIKAYPKYTDEQLK